MDKPEAPSNRKVWHGRYFGRVGEVGDSAQYRFGPLTLSLGEKRGWFRLFGYGLMWKDTRKWKPRFSVRNGYQGFYVFYIAFRLLTPR